MGQMDGRMDELMEVVVLYTRRTTSSLIGDALLPSVNSISARRACV